MNVSMTQFKIIREQQFIKTNAMKILAFRKYIDDSHKRYEQDFFTPSKD